MHDSAIGELNTGEYFRADNTLLQASYVLCVPAAIGWVDFGHPAKRMRKNHNCWVVRLSRLTVDCCRNIKRQRRSWFLTSWTQIVCFCCSQCQRHSKLTWSLSWKRNPIHDWLTKTTEQNKTTYQEKLITTTHPVNLEKQRQKLFATSFSNQLGGPCTCQKEMIWKRCKGIGNTLRNSQFVWHVKQTCCAFDFGKLGFPTRFMPKFRSRMMAPTI